MGTTTSRTDLLTPWFSVQHLAWERSVELMRLAQPPGDSGRLVAGELEMIDQGMKALMSTGEAWARAWSDGWEQAAGLAGAMVSAQERWSVVDAPALWQNWLDRWGVPLNVLPQMELAPAQPATAGPRTPAPEVRVQRAGGGSAHA